MRASLRPWLVGIAVAVAPLGVLAQAEQTHQYPECTNTSPNEVDVNTAKAAFQVGQTAFNEADYKKAIENWEEALHRDCTATLILYNLGLAYQLDGQRRQAVVALQTYLVRKPDAKDRDQVQKRIEKLQEQIQAEQPTPSTTPTAAPPPTSTAAPTASSPPPPAPSAGKRPILPLIVAGAGGAIFLGGTIGYVLENKRVNDFKSQCPEKPGKGNVCPNPGIQSDAESAVSTRNLMGGIAVGGLVVAAGGVVWYLVSKPESGDNASAQPDLRAKHPLVTPVVGGGFTGVSVSGAF